MALVAGRFANNPRLRQAAENSPAMKQGERGDAVAIVQQALVDLGFAMPVTTNSGRNLADGIVGRNTMAALDRLIIARASLKQSETVLTQGRAFTLKTAKTDTSLS